MNLSAVGQQIKRERENAHITQEQLALSIGCTTQHISAIERGVKTPRLDTFVRIANTLGVSADVLLQDALECTSNTLTDELSSMASPLPLKAQLQIIDAIRSLSKETSEETDHKNAEISRFV